MANSREPLRLCSKRSASLRSHSNFFERRLIAFSLADSIDGAALKIEAFNPRLYEHVQNRQEANDLSDQLCHAMNVWAEAGYLYGLAFGLTLGRGGAR
jgi:hypothetical protein